MHHKTLIVITLGIWLLAPSAWAFTESRDNNFFGTGAGSKNAGRSNTFIGGNAGNSNTTGGLNTFIGHRTGLRNTTGFRNTFLGNATGVSSTTGRDNTYLGSSSGVFNTTGRNNTFIGSLAGFANRTGSGNVFIGRFAGLFERLSNKLYITNSPSSDPLIYGEFDNDIVGINGILGVGTQLPTAPLHIRRADGTSRVLVEETNSTARKRELLSLKNKGGITMRMNNTNTSSIWDLSIMNGNFSISKKGTSGTEFEIKGNGDVIIGGTTLTVPDYVFAQDYQLMPLDVLKRFVQKKKHLPNVPSEADIKQAKGLNIGKTQMTHLEKIEELTLYTLQQHEQIKALKDKSVVMQKKTDLTSAELVELKAENTVIKKQLAEQNIALKTKNDNLQERLASLEKLVNNLTLANGSLGRKDKTVALMH
jgi:hypothetical protein